MVKTQIIIKKERKQTSRLILPKAQKRYAFSIAEAMITLTIVSVIAASMAPLISKQVKINELGDIQAQIISKKVDDVNSKVTANTNDISQLNLTIDNLEKQIATLDLNFKNQLNLKANAKTVTDLSESVTELEKEVEKLTPSGAVVFFAGNCPNNGKWTDVSADYAGKYFRVLAAGESVGSSLKSALPNLKGIISGATNLGFFDNVRTGKYLFYGYNQDPTHLTINKPLPAVRLDANGKQYLATTTGGGIHYNDLEFDASRYNSIYQNVNEVRPETIILRACKAK